MLVPTGWLSGFFVAPAENLFHHPQRRHEHVRRVGEKRRLIAFDQMSEPGERKCCRDEEQADDPMKPDHNDGREANRNCDHVQRPVYGMVVRTIVM